MTSTPLNLTPALHQYLLDVSLRDDPIRQSLRQLTLKMPMARMLSAPEQAQFMEFLIKLSGAKKALEIGVFTGYSALCVASALPEDGELIACDVSAEWTAIARDYWQQAGVADKIDLRLAPALDTLDGLLASDQQEQFDFCFIDADKENYMHYFERVLQLLKPGGLVVVDNILWSGRVIDAAVNDADTVAIRTFNQALLDDPRIDLSLLPIADGVTLIRKR